ncbi:MAG: hypothetical protein LBV50_01815 [Novosphingobium sp.]|nr:hypothetical protein [Novosphingobium sp.]
MSAKDVVTTPVTDFGIRKNAIPPLLTDAGERPYSLRGLGTCQQIATAIGEFDKILGDDVDLPQNAGGRVKPGRVAQSVVGSFIPFRGVIREVSGASEHDRQMRAAILAGVARRSFLKGIGQGRGCRYPARSATIEVYNQRMSELESKEQQSQPHRQDTAAQPAARQNKRGKRSN